MKQKVICDKAFICEEADGCDHAKPHFPELFHASKHSNKPDYTCVEMDQCSGYEVKCIPIGIDFELDGMFSL